MPTRPRLPIIDALRGFAVAQMIVYHFIYDLGHFGFIQVSMNRDQPWIAWRSAIVTQFLLIVGVSLVLRTAHRPQWRDLWRRWAQVVAAALLVSLATWPVFGPRYIYFGILHFIALALLIVRVAVPLGALNLLLAAGVLLTWWWVRDPAFNPVPANIIGLVTLKPATEDYVPLFPWLAAVFAGAGLAALWRRHDFALAAALQRLNAAPPRLLVWLGTWALTIYLAHQPILFSLLGIVRAIS